MRIGRPPPLPAPDPRTPWREAEFCVLDVETTGLDLDRDDIVSYGAALVVHGRIPCGRVVYREVRPERPVSVGALTVHGLRTADLAAAPPIEDILDEVVDLLSGRVLVAHAAWVERAFLDRVLRPRRHRVGRAVVDTAALLRACRLTASGTGVEPNLEAAAGRLGLPVHTPHHALGDAFTTAQLFLALATRLERSGHPLTVRDLYAISRHNVA
jgi:DNA polymerase III subunit epsilon